MKNMIKTCAYMGLSLKRMPFGENEENTHCVQLKKRLKNEFKRQIEEEGVCHFIGGMAPGTEMFCAEILLELREKYPFITLSAVIPYETQAKCWKEVHRDRYFRIAQYSDREVMLMKHYRAGCLAYYKNYLLNAADICILVGMQMQDPKCVEVPV